MDRIGLFFFMQTARIEYIKFGLTDVAGAVASNFDKLPENIQNLLFRLVN